MMKFRAFGATPANVVSKLAYKWGVNNPPPSLLWDTICVSCSFPSYYYVDCVDACLVVRSDTTRNHITRNQSHDRKHLKTRYKICCKIKFINGLYVRVMGRFHFKGYIYGTCKYYVFLWIRDIETVSWRHEWNRYSTHGHYTVVV